MADALDQVLELMEAAYARAETDHERAELVRLHNALRYQADRERQRLALVLERHGSLA